MHSTESLSAWARRAAATTGGPGETDDAAGVAAALPRHLLLNAAASAFEASEWASAKPLFARALADPTPDTDVTACIMRLGRCCLYLGDHVEAIDLLTAYVERMPRDPEGLFYLGRALFTSRSYREALNVLTLAQRLDGKRVKYLVAVGQTAHALAFGGFGHADDSFEQTHYAVAVDAFQAALKIRPEDIEARSALAMLLLDGGEIDEAIAEIGRMKAGDGRPAQRGLMGLAVALVRGGHADRVRDIEGLGDFDAGRRLLGRLARVTGEGATAPAGSSQHAGRIAYEAAPGRGATARLAAGLLGAGPRRARGFELAHFGPSVECDTVVVVRRRGWGAVAALAARLDKLPDMFAGIVERDAEGGIAVLVARRDDWAEFIRDRGEATWAEAAPAFARRYRLFNVGRKAANVAMAGMAGGAPRRMLVLSRHGPRRLGGGEHFLTDVSRTYARDCGAEVCFAGLSNDPAELDAGWTVEEPGLRSGFVGNDPAALRGFCIEQSIDAIHCISGMGEMVLEACRGLNVDIVYGIHFWREFIAADVPSQAHYFPYVGGEPRALATFRELLATATYCYVNSEFCSDIARDVYRWAPPVIHSVPGADWEDGTGEPPGARPPVDDYVLLPNCRADKGWHLFLDIAAAMPERPFLAIASQTDIGPARRDAFARGLGNVHVVGKATAMTEMYAQARVVLAPSFRFVETFCRVAVEPGRCGKPVLIADSGNLAYLGSGSELVLPEEPAAWVERIRAVYEDAETCARLTAQSVALARSFDADTVRAGARAAHAFLAGRRVLVCAGSGIGNICHVTPMIARLSEALGVRVDVLAAGDAPGVAALLGRSRHVASVFETYEEVRYRRYDAVLVTNSFGTVVPDFNADAVFESRAFERFLPGGEVHESAFNLGFLQAALGIGHAPEDAQRYFLGDWIHQPAADGDKVRVAIHAGSKGGHWSSKRWPHYERLVAALTAMGIEVVSVGVPEEAVAGAIDRTGVSLTALVDELTTCSAMIANDSGLMNVANAIGLPVVAIFGPTNPVTRGPINAPSAIVQPAIGCAPCEADPANAERFESGGCRCIGLVKPADVIAGLSRLVPEVRGARRTG